MEPATLERTSAMTLRYAAQVMCLSAVQSIVMLSTSIAQAQTYDAAQVERCHAGDQDLHGLRDIRSSGLHTGWHAACEQPT